MPSTAAASGILSNLGSTVTTPFPPFTKSVKTRVDKGGKVCYGFIVTANGQEEIWRPGERALNSGLFGDGGLPTHGPLRPANVSIEGDYLRWSYVSASKRLQVYEPRGTIDRFARIKAPGDVVRFAADYGVLGLCEHGFPVTQHWLLGYSVPEPSAGCNPSAIEGREALERWFHYSRVAHASMEIAIDLSHGRQPPRSLWETVWEDALTADRRSALPHHLAARINSQFPSQLQLLLDQMLANPAITLYGLVNEWVRQGGVRPMIIPGAAKGGPPTLHLAGSVFGLLGVQLMTIITGSASVATCSICDQPYFRERIPQRGRANYCSETCRKAGDKLRQRRRRATPRAQKGVNNEQAR